MMKEGEDIKAVLRCAAVEFLATCLFVYIGTGSAVSTGEFLAQTDETGLVARIMPISMAFGMSIMVLVYAFGHISGGHINPAVTLMLVILKDTSPIRGLIYIIFQLLGAILGSLILWGCSFSLQNDGFNTTALDLNGAEVARANRPPFNVGANTLNKLIVPGSGFLFEFMGTILLCLTVAFTVKHPGNLAGGNPSAAPIAIGFAVFLAHVVLVPFTGCGINPARTFGPAVVNSFAGENVWTNSWIYYIGPFAASFVSAGIFWLLCEECQEKDAKKETPPESAEQEKTPPEAMDKH